MHRVGRNARRYGLAILASLVALLLREMLTPLFGATNPYHTVWAAVAFAAWYCGVAPAVVTMLLSLAGVWYFFLSPFHSFALQNLEVEVSGMVAFLVFSGFIIALGEANRRSKARSEKEVAECGRIEEKLRKAQQELEHKVRERTAELEHNVAETREKAALLDLANDAIFVKAADGKISYWNRGAERLYGWTMSEALGHFPPNCCARSIPFRCKKLKAGTTGKGRFVTPLELAAGSWLQAAGLRCGIRTANQSLGSKSTRI
jgi:PAS domain-containing protein